MIKHPKNLQSAGSAKLFLEELANLREEPEASLRFWDRYKSFFHPGAFHVNETARSQWAQEGPWTTATPLSPEKNRQMLHEELRLMRDALREAWGITDPRRKEWKLFLLRPRFHRTSVAAEEQLNEPPPPCGMDFA